MPRDFKKIKAWDRARRLILAIYQVSKRLPKDEIYGLRSQIRRASVSVAANIAEGSSRQHKKDYLHFLYIAKSSLSEVECILIIIKDLNYLPFDEIKPINNILQETGKTLLGLINSVKREM